MHVNTVDPTGVKIVAGFYSLTAEPAAARPKTIFGHGSRCPQTGPGGQACEGNSWHGWTLGISHASSAKRINDDDFFLFFGSCGCCDFEQREVSEISI